VADAPRCCGGARSRWTGSHRVWCTPCTGLVGPVPGDAGRSRPDPIMVSREDWPAVRDRLAAAR